MDSSFLLPSLLLIADDRQALPRLRNGLGREGLVGKRYSKCLSFSSVSLECERRTNGTLELCFIVGQVM
jgi:hypothetical protein